MLGPRTGPYLQRNQTFPIAGAGSSQLVGPNAKRRAIIVSAPLPTDTPFVNEGTASSAVDTSTTGIKSTYTVPAGVQAMLTSAFMFETTGTTAIAALQLVRAATTFNLAQFTGFGTVSANVPLQAGDVIQWRVTTAIALSVTDFTINVQRERVPRRITLSTNAAAALDVGITVYQGTLPLYLHDDMIGSAITNEINVIGSEAGIQLSVIDVFDP